MDEVWRLMARLDGPGFRRAERAYAWDGPSHWQTVSLYAPASGKYVQVFGMPEAIRLPVAVADAVSLAELLRQRATEVGVDPWSSIVPKVVRPVLSHTHYHEQGTRDVDIYENGALELRWVPRPGLLEDDPWALTRRLRSGTLAEVQQQIERFDDDAAAVAYTPTERCQHELVTLAARRRVGRRRSAATRALVETIDALVVDLEPGGSVHS